MKSINNIVTEGLSGKIRQLVFRQRYGKTYAGKSPGERKTEPSVAQLNHMSLFKEAVAYAKAALADIAKKLAYQSKAKLGQSAYNVALADYLRLPEISDIDTGKFNGAVGDIIKIVAKDDFKVGSVLVRIEKPGGALIEEGAAADSGDGIYWTYPATVAGSNATGNLVIVTATDLPGHSIVKSKTM